MNKPEFTLDQIRKFVETGYTSVSARMVKSLLQHYDELSANPICPHCHKYKTMQGNGIMHQLCECGQTAP